MYNNLLKQGFSFVLNGNEEKRVIDTNSLVARRLEELKEAARARGMDPDQEDGASGGFVQGIDAADVSALLGADGESGNVLKAETAKEKAQSILEEAETQAQSVLEAAKIQAEQALQDARRQAEDLKLAAVEEGRQNGYREGRAQADAEAGQLRKQMKDREAQLEAQYQSALDQMEPQLVEAITGIYEHIFHVELRSSRDILVHLIATTLRKAEGSRDFLVHVSKEDYSYVSMQKKQLLAVLPGNGVTLEIIEDMTVGKDGCMIETEGGIFDCGLGTQLEQLRRKLTLLSYTG